MQPPTARRYSSSSTTIIPLLQLPDFLPAARYSLFFILIIFCSLWPSSLLVTAAHHDFTSPATTAFRSLLQPPRVSLSLSLSVFGEMKASPFGFVIKLPLPQPEPEPPVGEGQEHLPKQGASDQQPQHPNLGISSSSSGWRQCSYTVTIKTSCSSPRITRDAISLAFGDAYRHEVYAARLDDPASGTFERCSIDTFRVTGPCGDRTCYLYLRRSGRDGWTPEYVKIFYIPGDTRSAVTFYYKVPLPYGVWYGFNLCHGGGGATIPSTVFKLFQGTEETGNDVGRKDTDSEVMYETEMERSN